jgi:hypothetical protein
MGFRCRLILIDDQHGILCRETLNHVVPHHVVQRVGLPATAAENGLLTPGRRISCCLGPHPAYLTPLNSEQAIQEQSD